MNYKEIINKALLTEIGPANSDEAYQLLEAIAVTTAQDIPKFKKACDLIIGLLTNHAMKILAALRVGRIKQSELSLAQEILKRCYAAQQHVKAATSAKDFLQAEEAFAAAHSELRKSNFRM